MTPAFSDRQVRQYVLGDLPPQEAEAIETAYFSDADLLSRIELARHDLADDYAAGRLDVEERNRFERHVLSTADGRREQAVAEALRLDAARATAPIRPAWRTDYRWLGLAAAVVMGAGIFIAWQRMASPESSRQVASSAVARPAPESPAVGTTPEPPSPSAISGRVTTPSKPVLLVASLVLTTDLARNSGQPPTLAISSDITHVDLVAPEGTPTGPVSGRARVQTVEGQTVWEGDAKRSGEGSDQQRRSRVPAASLRPGDYLFTIESGESEPGLDAQYYFRIRSR